MYIYELLEEFSLLPYEFDRERVCSLGNVFFNIIIVVETKQGRNLFKSTTNKTRTHAKINISRKKSGVCVRIRTYKIHSHTVKLWSFTFKKHLTTENKRMHHSYV